MKKIDHDPDHPIIDFPFMWEISEWSFHRDLADFSSSYIDIVFEREGQRKRLRFLGPQELTMKGLPWGFGTYILDITARQLEGIRVEVGNFEHANVRFLAARVVEVTE